MIVNDADAIRSVTELERIIVSPPTLTGEMVRDEIQKLFVKREYVHVIPSFADYSDGRSVEIYKVLWGSGQWTGDSPGGWCDGSSYEELLATAKEMIVSDWRYIGTGMRKCDGTAAGIEACHEDYQQDQTAIGHGVCRENL